MPVKDIKLRERHGVKDVVYGVYREIVIRCVDKQSSVCCVCVCVREREKI